MDVAFNQHASHVRRKNRSTTNLNRLSLAPLTTKLPLDYGTSADDYHPDPVSAPPSYLQGKSAPTTPRLLSRSPGPFPRRPVRSISHTRTTSSTPAAIPKAKSTTHLHRPATPSQATSTAQRPGQRRGKHDNGLASANETDWLLRAGALISTETRESKGQSWLVSRASSVSLAGSDPERAEEEPQLARERGYFASRHASRRGSLVAVDEQAVHVVSSSPAASRLGSRSQSRASLMTPSEQQQRRRSVEGYFVQTSHYHSHAQPDDENDESASYAAGPDFVSLDTKLEAVETDTSHEDEAHVRRLVKSGGAGGGSWLGSVLGWSLFSVEENEEESDDEDDREMGEVGDGSDEAVELPAQARRRSSARQFEALPLPAEERIPPPKADEGGWQDAAWLLSVASKVLL